MSAPDNVSWRMAGFVASMSAEHLARRAATACWRKARGEDPPDDPTSPGIRARDVLLWAVVSGVVVATARFVALRTVSAAWRSLAVDTPQRAGHLPAVAATVDEERGPR